MKLKHKKITEAIVKFKGVIVKVGLLINFGKEKLEFKRFVFKMCHRRICLGHDLC